MLKKIIPLLLLTGHVLLTPTSAQAGDRRFINLVAFQSDTPGFHYEAIVNGSLGELISSVGKYAHVILASRTDALRNQDIINLQSDVMRMTHSGNLASGGLDCRFIFNDESDEDSAFYSISGLCSRETANTQGTEKKQMIIKRKMLSDPSPTFNTWLKLYDDPKLGVAFYTDID